MTKERVHDDAIHITTDRRPRCIVEAAADHATTDVEELRHATRVAREYETDEIRFALADRMIEHDEVTRVWDCRVRLEFAGSRGPRDERRAIAFERYLKSGSGVAFARRHLR